MTTAADRRQWTHHLPEARAEDVACVERFLDAAWAEYGLAKASLAAYHSDLSGLARWLHAESKPLLMQALQLIEQPRPGAITRLNVDMSSAPY